MWTSLLDPEAAPAREVGELHAWRWEHELYCREVKRQLWKTDVRHSHTPDTAAQEIAALVLASAVLAGPRARAATGAVPVLRISFGRVLRVVTAIWVATDPGAGILSDAQIAGIIDRGYARMRRYVTTPRRSRSCPPAVRQLVTGWPRLIKNASIEAPLEFTVV